MDFKNQMVISFFVYNFLFLKLFFLKIIENKAIFQNAFLLIYHYCLFLR